MSILSVTAVAALAERHVRTDGPTTPTDLALHLADHYGVDPVRVSSAINRAIDNGRLEHHFTDDTLHPTGNTHPQTDPDHTNPEHNHPDHNPDQRDPEVH